MVFKPSVSWQIVLNLAIDQELGNSKAASTSDIVFPICS